MTYFSFFYSGHINYEPNTVVSWNYLIGKDYNVIYVDNDKHITVVDGIDDGEIKHNITEEK